MKYGSSLLGFFGTETVTDIWRRVRQCYCVDVCCISSKNRYLLPSIRQFYPIWIDFRIPIVCTSMKLLRQKILILCQNFIYCTDHCSSISISAEYVSIIACSFGREHNRFGKIVRFWLFNQFFLFRSNCAIFTCCSGSCTFFGKYFCCGCVQNSISLCPFRSEIFHLFFLVSIFEVVLSGVRTDCIRSFFYLGAYDRPHRRNSRSVLVHIHRCDIA